MNLSKKLIWSEVAKEGNGGQAGAVAYNGNRDRVILYLLSLSSISY